MRGATSLLAAALCLAATSVAVAQDLVVRNAHVVPVSSDPIEGGSVLVLKGRVKEVGAKVKAPSRVEVVDAKGGWLIPGFVHPVTHLGLRGNGTGGETTFSPTRTPESELNPWLEANTWTAANGFTTLGLMPGPGTVGGSAWVVRSAGESPESMVRAKDAYVRVNVTVGARFISTLSGNLAKARKELDGHAKWKRDHATWKEANAKAVAEKKKPPAEPKEPKLSDTLKPLRRVLSGEAAMVAFAGSSADLRALADALADDAVRGDRMRLYVVASGTVTRVPELLLDLGATCVVRTSVETWSGSRDLFHLATHLHELGLPLVLTPSSDSRETLRRFPTQLALAVRSGLPRDVALRACTLGAAELLGVEKDVGSIAEGRRADLLLFSGDPLDPTSRLLRVWIDGREVEATP